MREKLISCLQDTLEISKQIFMDETNRSIQSNIVYPEGFVSTKPKRMERAPIIVEANTTFASAKKYLPFGKVAVLNFANPEIPGGGVKNGAMAQEECLCRSSNLYSCLSDANVFENYYQYHRNLRSSFSSDRLIYTQGVKVFKDDGPVPQMLPPKEWFHVDVITCSAPSLRKRKYTNTEALLRLFQRRIKNILEVAREYEVDVIILGAFGCGAFRNPPLVVAQAFEQVIQEGDYRSDFKQIIFAIKPTGQYCPNLSTFRRQFDRYEPDAEYRWALLPEDPSERFRRTPSLMVDKLSNNQAFTEWQRSNVYFGKQFSILGDSISTLEGYNPSGYAVFYSGENCVKSGVCEMQDTWWDKVISFFGGELLVNSAWSGSRVTKLPKHTDLFPSGCSDERTSSLHINSVVPDVIIVYMGTNDWAYGARIGGGAPPYQNDAHEYFSIAYDLMLKKIKRNYPMAEVWCCTISETVMSSNPSFQFPHKYAGTHTEMYNEIIRRSACDNACRLIDLYGFHMPYDSVDGSHPTKAGMETIATEVVCSVGGADANRLLGAPDISAGVAVETGEINKQIKALSGRDMSMEDGLKSVKKSEYVLLDPEITAVLYSNMLRLTDVESREIVEITKDVVTVGKDATNDLWFTLQRGISHQHATFFYERELWFLCDNGSNNGTWINGLRLKPGNKYQLTANDEINFGMSKRMIFYEYKPNVESGEVEGKHAVSLLEKGLATYVASGYQDKSAFRTIITALTAAPLYVPVLVDVEAMLGGVNPVDLVSGNQIQLSQNAKMKVSMLKLKDDEEIIPLYTSEEEMRKGQNDSKIKYYPADLIPMILKMGKRVAINPFSEERILLNQSFFRDLVLPLMQKENKQESKCDYSDSNATDGLEGMLVKNRYELLETIGKGGVSTVYRAVDKKTNQQWAIKVIDKNFKSPIVLNSVLQEHHMVIKFTHPAIPQIVNVEEDPQYIYIVQELVYGETLEDRVRIYGPQPPERVVDWAIQICDVVGYLHGLNPPHIHRDVKPANLILTPEGEIKIIDFGIMRQFKPGVPEDECVLGTRGYAPPEQYGGQGQTDARADIYAIGVTLYRLLTGIDACKLMETRSLRRTNPNLPAKLDKIIMKCTEADKKKRYQTCKELKSALISCGCGQQTKGLFGKLFGK